MSGGTRYTAKFSMPLPEETYALNKLVIAHPETGSKIEVICLQSLGAVFSRFAVVPFDFFSRVPSLHMYSRYSSPHLTRYKAWTRPGPWWKWPVPVNGRLPEGSSCCIPGCTVH